MKSETVEVVSGTRDSRRGLGGALAPGRRGRSFFRALLFRARTVTGEYAIHALEVRCAASVSVVSASERRLGGRMMSKVTEPLNHGHAGVGGRGA